jgi:inactivated superfamily I helicase
MDEFVRKAAALGLPAIMLVIVMAPTGLAGAAAITTALAALGGPAGMLGGIALLGIIGLATEMLSKYGLESVLIGIYRQRLQNGESKSRLCGEMRNLPISTELKRTLKENLGC